MKILYSEFVDEIEEYYSNELEILIINKRKDEDAWQAVQSEKEEKRGPISLI